jgi:hypothetical protein
VFLVSPALLLTLLRRLSKLTQQCASTRSCNSSCRELSLLSVYKGVCNECRKRIVQASTFIELSPIYSGERSQSSVCITQKPQHGMLALLSMSPSTAKCCCVQLLQSVLNAKHRDVQIDQGRQQQALMFCSSAVYEIVSNAGSACNV